jgi:hypothetical protein
MQIGEQMSHKQLIAVKHIAPYLGMDLRTTLKAPKIEKA